MPLSELKNSRKDCSAAVLPRIGGALPNRTSIVSANHAISFSTTSVSASRKKALVQSSSAVPAAVLACSLSRPSSSTVRRTAARVEATALEFLGQVAGSWDLDDPQAELALKWAARLHEIGLDVAHSGYHRHGAYLLENADLPGFAREEQLLLARLVGAHRKKLSLAGVEDLIPPWDRRAIHLIMLLRLSVLLHRGRTTTALPPIELAARARTLELRFPARWLKDHPLSAEDLQVEIDNLRVQGLKLRVYSGNRAAAA